MKWLWEFLVQNIWDILYIIGHLKHLASPRNTPPLTLLPKSSPPEIPHLPASSHFSFIGWGINISGGLDFGRRVGGVVFLGDWDFFVYAKRTKNIKNPFFDNFVWDFIYNNYQNPDFIGGSKKI